MSKYHLADQLASTAEIYPQKVALVVGGAALSYRDMLAKARSWADKMGRRCQKLERVGILAARSEEAYVGVVAALLANATYVPLNTRFPQSRTRMMMELADLDAVIVDSEGLAQVGSLLTGRDTVAFKAAPNGDLVDVFALDSGKDVAATAPGIGVQHSGSPRDDDRPAYLLFTSGSTGQPKGVPVSHRSVGSFLRFNSERYAITPEDRLGQTFDLTFDLSVFDMFMAWAHGAALCVPSRLQLISPYRFMADHGVTLWFCVPSLAHLLIQRGSLKAGSLPSLRWSLFCGEALPAATAAAWSRAAPNSVVENLYGPTELTIACAVHRCGPSMGPGHADGDLVPLGRLYPHMIGVVVDENGQEVPGGEIGELCIAGPQQFAGYWRDEKKTRAAHLRLPSGDGNWTTFYRTGDRVRRDGLDGTYHFVGRVDQQIKVSGHRIELGEIEMALRQVAEVTEAAAIGWPRQPNGFAGIQAFATGRGLQLDALMEHLRRVLPPYMVPNRVHLLASFPLNGNGKIDKLALARGICEQRGSYDPKL